jgi:hypothetical protein
MRSNPNDSCVLLEVQRGRSIYRNLVAVKPKTTHSLPNSAQVHSVQILEYPAACNFLTDPANLLLLDPFFDHELSVTELAVSRDITRNAAFKIVRKLEALGLIECSREAKRGGKAIKYYRTVAAQFFVPFSRIPAEQFVHTLNAHNWQMVMQAIGQLFAEGRLVEQGYGAITLRAANGRIGLLPGRSDGSTWDVMNADFPAFLGQWSLLRLDFEQAKALQFELASVLEKYLPSNGSGEYLSSVFLVERRKTQ